MTMSNRLKHFLIWILPVAIVCLLLVYFFTTLGSSSPEPNANIKEETFAFLEDIRISRQATIIEQLTKMQQTAENINNDKQMIDFFVSIKNNDGFADGELEFEVDRHFVSNYYEFYDILFVDPTGFIFHSVLKESDWHTNLFTSEATEMNLVTQMQESSGNSFAEFEYYVPSDEPAAFFAIPVENNKQHIGWFVLQYPVNAVNAILTDYRDLGRTGEVYLVSEDKLMLTESRFLPDSTILKLNVNTQAVKNAMRDGSGEDIIEDYRGERVFSSYKQFDCLDTSWLILAEIDEDEVITEHFKKYEEHYLTEIPEYLANLQTVQQPPELWRDEATRIDMNEFARAEAGDLLATFGVSECTSVVITYKDNFGYMAHIGPGDMIYTSDKATSSDFLGKMIRKITYYDVRPCDIRELECIIVAPHLYSLGNTVNTLLNHGLELDNIKFVYVPSAYSSANILLDATNWTVKVQWNELTKSYVVPVNDIPTLDDVVKTLELYDA